MSHRKTLSRLTIASLVAAGIAAPAATAIPAGPPVGTVKDHWQAHMPTTATKPETTHQERRGEAAVDQSQPRVRHPRLVGPPTWPENPEPIGRAETQSAGGDGGVGDDDVPVLALVIGGALVLGGGMAVTAVRLRARTAH
jgi:hypothetical protein